MPVCNVHLLALQPNISIAHFLGVLSTNLPTPPLVVSRVIRWIVLPKSIDATQLLAHPWDLLVIYEGTQGELPEMIRAHLNASYSVKAGIPSSLTKGFQTTNKRTLYPHAGDVPALTGASDKPRISPDSQDLEMSADLYEWIARWDPRNARGAVSMLNLLAFKEGMHGEYLKYGKAFAETVGSSRGGSAKLVGKVVGIVEQEQKSKWDEMALAHYPSIWHFADMISSADYQDVNKRHRVGSLKDTCILFTSELELPNEDSSKARL